MENPVENNEVDFNEFSKLQTNYERIQYTYKYLKNLNSLPDNEKSINAKNEIQSYEMRVRANNFVIDKNDFETALQHYNEALCLAPKGSRGLAVIYIRRAAIYFNAKFYRFCKENLDLAMKVGNLENLSPGLIWQREVCLKKMGTPEDAEHIHKNPEKVALSHTANPKIPCISDKVKMARNFYFGRHMVASEDIAPGDIILKEKPFIRTLMKENIYKNCNRCTKGNYYNLFPCTQSTVAMFCSNECLTKSHTTETYKYEWPILNEIYKLFPDYVYNAIRTALEAFTQLEEKDLNQFVFNVGENDEHILSLNYQKAIIRDRFRAYFSLATNENKRSTKDLFKVATMSAKIWHLLFNFTDLKALLLEKSQKILFQELLMKTLMIAAINCHDIVEKNVDVGNGISLVYSCLNHSCAPNVARLALHDMNVVFAIQSIKAGCQIFDSYGPIYSDMKKSQRQAKIKKTYLFKCQCVACTYDYPIAGYLEMKGFFPQQLNFLKSRPSPKVIDEQTKNIICDALTKHSDEMPCWDIYALQEYLIQYVYSFVDFKLSECVFKPKSNS